MTSLNKWIGIGRLGKDPSCTKMNNGTSVTNISIVCNEKYKDKQGVQKEASEWINIVFFGQLADIAMKYLNKGSLICVEGKLKTDKYIDKVSGVEKFSSKIVAENLKMLSGEKKEKEKEPNGNFADSYLDDVPF